MKIKFGAIVTDGRGKLGGHVFSKNAAGAIMRTKVTPSNPKTAAQSLARAMFASISQLWSALTQLQRDAWTEAVPEWQKTNIFGDLKKPTGKALFQRLNNQAQAAGWPAVTSVPVKAELPTEIVSAATLAIGAGTITLTGMNTAASNRIMLWATAPLSAGTSGAGSKLRLVYTSLASTYVAADAYDAYEAKFGVPTAGDNIFIGVKNVIVTGQASPIQTLSAVITA